MGDAVQIDCTEHLTHKVPLYTYGNKYAGIWECTVSGEGLSGSCSHYDLETLEVEDTSGNKRPYTVCVLCGVEVGL